MALITTAFLSLSISTHEHLFNFGNKYCGYDENQDIIHFIGDGRHYELDPNKYEITEKEAPELNGIISSSAQELQFYQPQNRSIIVNNKLYYWNVNLHSFDIVDQTIEDMASLRTLPTDSQDEDWGGWVAGGCFTYSKTIGDFIFSIRRSHLRVYDIRNNMWFSGPHMFVFKEEHIFSVAENFGCAISGNHLYVFGGIGMSDWKASNYTFKFKIPNNVSSINPAMIDAWTFLDERFDSTGLEYISAVSDSNNDKIWLLGGQNKQGLAVDTIFEFHNDQFTSMENKLPSSDIFTCSVITKDNSYYGFSVAENNSITYCNPMNDCKKMYVSLTKETTTTTKETATTTIAQLLTDSLCSNSINLLLILLCCCIIYSVYMYR